MHSRAIPLKELTFKIVRQAYLCHQVTAYDHIIAYARFDVVAIDMEAMINCLAARKLRNAKRHFNIMCRSVHASGCTIL